MEFNTRGRLCSSLYVIRQAERRFIGLRTILESALVSHKADLRNRANPPWGGAQASYFGWKFTRIKLPPMRNSVPSCNMAARTRSSSKKVPLVESMSLRLMYVRFSHFQQAVMPRN